MKKYFDRKGQEIKVGMMLLYEWGNGSGCNDGPVVERDGDLGTVDYFSSEFISLSVTDLAHARINPLAKIKE